MLRIEHCNKVVTFLPDFTYSTSAEKYIIFFQLYFYAPCTCQIKFYIRPTLLVLVYSFRLHFLRRCTFFCFYFCTLDCPCVWTELYKYTRSLARHMRRSLSNGQFQHRFQTISSRSLRVVSVRGDRCGTLQHWLDRTAVPCRTAARIAGACQKLVRIKRSTTGYIKKDV